MPTRNELINCYRKLSDAELMRLALHEADVLIPEALDVLKEEIKTRRLAGPLEAVIGIQTRLLSPEEEQALVAAFRRLPCPICGAAAGLLNAAVVATALSFLIKTVYDKKTVVGCPHCIVAAARRARVLTLALGWWAIPWGPIRTVQAIIINDEANLTAREDGATPALTQYVAANRGAVVHLLQQRQGGQASGQRQTPG